jgi:hypothetical protein
MNHVRNHNICIIITVVYFNFVYYRCILLGSIYVFFFKSSLYIPVGYFLRYYLCYVYIRTYLYADKN